MEEVFGSDLQPNFNRNKKKIKIIIFSIVALFIIFGGIAGWLKYQQVQEEKKKEEYASLLAETSVEMHLEFLLSSIIIASYSDVWEKAIDNGNDFNVQLTNFRKELTKDGLLEKREKGQDKIRDNMKLLQDPPKEYLGSYVVLKQMYGIYTKMVDQTLSPTGSLLDFNRKTNDLASQFAQQLEELIITLPSDVKKLKKKFEEEKKKDKSVNGI